MTSTSDQLTVIGVQPYTAPVSLEGSSKKSRTKATPQASLDDSNVKVDRICADCTQSFPSVEAMMSHCSVTGHFPQVVGSKKETPANNEVFLAYCNCALKRAL